MFMAIKQNKRLLEQVKEYIIIALIVVLFNNFILSCNLVPTSSMVSTINEGDRILVSMLPYYYKNPIRGEIVVFHHGDQVWVKRVVGLPGEMIDIHEGNIYINNELFDESGYLSVEGISDPNPRHEPISFPYEVPEESYFLMGDNRLESHDSRYIGAVNANDIIGKAIIRIYPFNQMGLLK